MSIDLEQAELHLEKKVPYVSFPVLSKYSELRHGFSTRLMGVSKGIYSSMNLGLGRGDSEENVLENYRRICESMEIPVESLVFSKQTHKALVRKVTADDRGIGLLRSIPYDDVDAHMTNEPGVGLVIFGSDCVPIYLYDPVKKVIALCHGGWRGTVGRIAGKTVKAMEETYGTKAEDVVAVIGPSICMDCFEIGDEVAEEFVRAFAGAESEKSPILRKYNEKYHADLWEANARALAEVGVPRINIHKSGLCTMCRQELFFSHRGSGGRRGSNAGFLMLAGTAEGTK